MKYRVAITPPPFKCYAHNFINNFYVFKSIELKFEGGVDIFNSQLCSEVRRMCVSCGAYNSTLKV